MNNLEKAGLCCSDPEHLLCTICHPVYDDPEPGCTIVPEGLDYFIQNEEHHIERRQTIFNKNQRNMRSNPHSTPLAFPALRYPTAQDYLEA